MQLIQRKTLNRNTKLMRHKEAQPRYFCPGTKISLNQRKRENSCLVGWINTEEIIINHKGTRMVEDGED